MLIVTSAVLAMRCPECGKMEFNDFSRFVFPRGKTVNIICSCGALKLTVVTKNRVYYSLRIPCPVCESQHPVEISGSGLWSGEVTRLSCLETDLELGHIGPESKIVEMISKQEQELEDLVNEFGCDGYFHNSDIMYEVLSRLHEIAGRGGLYCQCGNHKIEVDLFPDCLELQCKNCDSVNIIYAETEEDLSVIRQVDTIELARHGFRCLDNLADADKHKKSRHKRSKT
ncbi:MAG: hypothetical protein PHS52_07705 [Desulfotomaculaceae bacterium]|nr:hypothetical protein [Desulfotomaculaceae bacterium]